jgi:hypothetical protein
MDLLTQAKQFLARKASKLAMVAVPLAALAVAIPAKATTVVLDGGGTDNCFAESSGTCTLTTNPTGGNAFLNQVVMTGTAVSSGGFANLGNSGSGTTNSGSFSGIVPVMWNFSITGNSGPVEWSVDFNLNEGAFDFSMSGSTTGGTVISSGSISVPTSTSIFAYSMNVSANGSGGFTLTAPLVLNSAAQTSAPEPGSVLLMGAGGAALLLVRRKRKV